MREAVLTFIMPEDAGLCSVQPLWAWLEPIISLDDKLQFNLVLGSLRSMVIRSFGIHPTQCNSSRGLGSRLVPEVCTTLYLCILSKHPNIQAPLTPTLLLVR